MEMIKDWSEVPLVFDVVVAARILGISPHCVTKRCQRGSLTGFKFGKTWRFEKAAFKKYIEDKQNQVIYPCPKYIKYLSDRKTGKTD